MSTPPTWAVEARQRLEACARAELAKHVAAGAPCYVVHERDVERDGGGDPVIAEVHTTEKIAGVIAHAEGEARF